jgi:exoribonuclease-2
MYALFEESGKLATGRLLSQAQSSAQIELDSGKRVKVKDSAILLKFESPTPDQLLTQAQAIAPSIDLQIAWEFAPSEEFGFADLSVEYFSAQPSLGEQLAILQTLFSAPHYFRRAGKGRFKKASADTVQQALLAIEKKKEIAAQIDAWAAELAKGECPHSVKADIYKILFKPDKNASSYKAVVQAAKLSQTPAMALLMQAGAIQNAYEFHWQRFLFDQFPKGTQFPSTFKIPSAAELEKLSSALPLSSALAYSIDDSQTTEIDDALSVQGLGSDQITLGVHIAAPALWIQANDSTDELARARLSTVYMPGAKITMLPDSVIEHFTLEEGRDCPAVSLYTVIQADTLEIESTYSRVERVHIQKNLRHDRLDHIVTAEWLMSADQTDSDSTSKDSKPELESTDLPHAELAFLYKMALKLKAARELARGKPENFNRPDFNFHIDKVSGAPIKGDETVKLEPRKRGAPLDLIVAEAMILANNTWGRLMSDLGVPGIYRSQLSMAPGIKVRMSTKALPHAGIGVDCYAWSTSPLRRYTDLVNQWQICACVQHGATAALMAPFKPKQVELHGIISAFESAYTSYNAYQSSMERYWTLKYIEQQKIEELQVTVFKSYPGTPALARSDALPLALSINGGPELNRGAVVKVKLSGIDLMKMDIQADFVELCESPVATNEVNAELSDIDDLDESDAQAQAHTTLSLDLELDEAEQSEQNTESAPIQDPQSGSS